MCYSKQCNSIISLFEIKSLPWAFVCRLLVAYLLADRAGRSASTYHVDRYRRQASLGLTLGKQDPLLPRATH